MWHADSVDTSELVSVWGQLFYAPNGNLPLDDYSVLDDTCTLRVFSELLCSFQEL